MTRAVLAAALIALLSRTEPAPYQVDALAPGVYAFRAGFYTSLFVATPEGVIATDPISPAVAQLYKRAIREITREPVRYVIYSHDHTDHIAGGAVFRDTARFVAQENAVARIRARHNPAIVPPDVTFRDDYTLTLGGTTVRLLYFGDNHSPSNVAILLPAERILMFVDMVYPGSVPFRDLPGTDVRSFLATLPRIRALDFQTLVYGHGPAGTREWVDRYAAYFDDLIAALTSAQTSDFAGSFAASGLPVDPRAALDRYVDAVVARAVASLRPKYGRWGGFDEWAPMNAKAVYFYLMMDT
jgi:glyoxylase-like metal-dependent hydrolase (beta-lactamase superfamily II)